MRASHEASEGVRRDAAYWQYKLDAGFECSVTSGRDVSYARLRAGVPWPIRSWLEGLFVACSLPVHCLFVACSLLVYGEGWQRVPPLKCLNPVSGCAKCADRS